MRTCLNKQTSNETSQDQNKVLRSSVQQLSKLSDSKSSQVYNQGRQLQGPAEGLAAGAGEVAQLVKGLPRKCEVQNLISSTLTQSGSW